MLQSTLATLPDDRPTSQVPVITKATVEKPSPVSPLPLLRRVSIIPTDVLIQSQATAYFQAHHRPPSTLALHPFRLIMIASNSWGRYPITGLGMVALRGLTLVECQEHGVNAVDTIRCE